MEQIPPEHLSGNTVYLAESLVPVCCQLWKSLASGVHHPWPLEIDPFPLRNKFQAFHLHVLRKIRRNKPHIPLKHGRHAQLFHAGHDVPSQLRHLGQRSSVPFQVAHVPPGGKGWIGDEAESLFPGIPQADEKILPGFLQACRYQRVRKPAQGQEINLALPSFPIPESCRIGQSAIIIRKNGIPRRFNRDGTGRSGQRRGKLQTVSIPGKMHLGNILQIPPIPRCRPELLRWKPLHPYSGST